MSDPIIPTTRLAPGIKPASRLALGISSFGQEERGFPVFDRFFEAGGNFFDSAWVYGINYGEGVCEKTLGSWLASRGVHDDVVLLGKGCHPPHCTPDSLAPQLTQTLERLRADHIDIHMLHRDDPRIPVGEFVDALCALVTEGSIRAYGFSNWTIERIEEARAYARRNNLPTPAGVSNNLSLAEMIKPIYDGCISLSDRESRTWLAHADLPVIPWSSQGRGVFTLPSPDTLAASPLTECWYSEANVERARRAWRLAADRDVLPVNIALAYVLNLPYATFPIIGPRTVDELVTSLPALDLRLSPDELRWLAVEDG
ncbi:aryl-alcohol dehydrogenase-like predicted oxidoreductase [Tamaricihabitans halophyticus]|uniref:Aryl-alcohol dehydrogenase-like predicted oxidoreductase n=1 Tax=Tamaricihabitans halophyticus TaxID=1262583 RepID=A0A4R2R4S0_9PSEU|nr:aldo/keto reductase [Tamaricihabitans halophyticus]TCP56779.1 aryl-alcohol dehydrogenase-like predicted oxidoreductase [Tamaricihabitans halophyticus]